MKKSSQLKIREIGEWLGEGSVNAFGRQFAGKDERMNQLGQSIGAPVLSGGEV